jgi:predicted RNase H-like nuclease
VLPYTKTSKKTTAVGIDGCPGGWIAAVCRADHSVNWRMEARIADILEQLPQQSTILIDMIIGLPDRETPSRLCDLDARRILNPHGSRVFSAPPREALAASCYPEACALARAATGKAISKQCWHLFPKIRELDALDDPRIKESHPELVFARLNGGQAIAASKKSAEGQTLRLKRLTPLLSGTSTAYEAVLRRFRRKDLARDDAIDALALCAAATRPGALQTIPPDGPQPRIWY